MFWKKPLNLIIASLLAVVFFIGTASFNYLTQDSNYVKWSSPDETANYFFAKHFAQTGQLAVFDPASVIGDNLLMPRSVRSDAGLIKPVSFLGIILVYGSLGALFGIGIIPYLTPLFAALGIIFFYLLVRRLFSERIALWSAFLLAGFPVYIYYTARSMFHNVLFLVFLIAGLYLFVLSLGRPGQAPERQKFFVWFRTKFFWLESAAALGAGLLFGLALITRTSELLWLAPVLLILGLFYLRRLGLTKLMLIVAGLALAFLPVFYYNQILYGSFWHGGYNEMNRSLDDLARTGGAIWQFTWGGQFQYYRHALGQIFRQVFYFGFNYSQSIEMLRHYVLEMFAPLVYAAALGLLILIVQNCRRFQKKYLTYILAWLAASALLIFYYGSWKFNDNPDLTRFTIGNSYTRYWLPLYLGLMPLAALAIVRVSRACLAVSRRGAIRARQIWETGLQAVAVLIYLIISLVFVLYGSEEGLAYLYYNNLAEKLNAERVWSLTEPDAIIITRYYDKFFWPERRVIMGTIPDDEILRATAKLIEAYPVYYYNFYLNDADVAYLDERKLNVYGLNMRLVRKLNARFGLYRIERAMITAPLGATSTPAYEEKNQPSGPDL
ncbi:MAG: glycosyltransferase family 39 protein [Patescibacteria group bacterium]